MKNRKVLVVGAGLSGTTVARLLAEAGIDVTVIDRRGHVAGNAYDEVNELGLRLHRYGPHIFHTSNEKVVEFLSKFTTWIPYKHKVKAMLASGELVTLPVNLETAEKVGRENIIDIFYRPYTKKMWGVDIEELDPGIVNRVPVREDMNEYYFPNDSFQALPEHGYTGLIMKMLDHRNIQLRLSTSYEKQLDKDFFHVFNSMSIDEYFENDLGVLPYRSLRFHTYTIPVPRLFPVSQVNFTHSEKYTRITEWKNFPNHGFHPSKTTVTVEEPCDFLDNNYERYYPIKDVSNLNRKLYLQYRERVPKNHTFIGRCGLYAYLDMHQAVSTSLQTGLEFLKLNNCALTEP
jgi:UDP-galactopyranose mutase